MPSRSALPPSERQLRSRLRQLLNEAEGFLHGSAIELSRKCGKPSCRCASDDSKRHRSLAVGQTRKGKTTMLHVPKSLEAQARCWLENFQRATDLLEALDEQARLRLKEAKARAKAQKDSGRSQGKPAVKKKAATGRRERKPPRQKKRPS